MKKTIAYIFIIVFIVFSICFNVIQFNKKYLIINNDFMFEIKKNTIKAVKRYPSYLNNSKIKYYDNGIREDGFIKIINKKLKIDQVNGSNIKLYTSNHNYLYDMNIIATYNLDDININDYISLESDVLNEKDNDNINEYIDEESIEKSVITHYKKYDIDLNGDKKLDNLYILSDASFNDSEKKFEVSEEKYENTELIFANINGKNINIIKNVDKSKRYDLIGIIDLYNDNKKELLFSITDNKDYNYLCEAIYKLNDDNYKSIKNCVLEAK